jgi:hypothetical protein
MPDPIPAEPDPLKELLQRIKTQADSVSFAEVMAIIDSHYDYQPSGFDNGCNDDMVHNPAGSNEGSCKIFAFARLNHLDAAQTLACFGDYYRIDVLASPDGTDHGNIRHFIRHGWAGIRFEQFPLNPRH